MKPKEIKVLKPRSVMPSSGLTIKQNPLKRSKLLSLRGILTPATRRSRILIPGPALLQARTGLPKLSTRHLHSRACQNARLPI